MMDDVKFYLSLLLRRWYIFLFVAAGIAGVGITIALTLPAEYEAKARLVVESPQIPGGMARSTVSTESTEQLQIIRQRILARSNLLDMSRRFKIHADRPNLNPDQIVVDIRDRIKVNLPNRRDAASFVTISFVAPSANMSAAVTNDLVTQILQESVALRTAASGQTLQFFEQEITRLDGELALQSAKILQFKLANKDALPDSMTYRRTRQASLQERQLQMERELASLRDRRENLVVSYERTGSVNLPEQALSPDQRLLKKLKSDLAIASSVYSEQNPRIKSLKLRITNLETHLAGLTLTTEAGTEELSLYEIQLADLDGQIEFLNQQIIGTETELSALEVSIDATPENAIKLGTLDRDYRNLREQYDNAADDFALARTGDQLEAQSRGQKISIIEQATPPREPTQPNRRRLALVSIGGGILAGLGLVALLEMMNSAIRRPTDITTRLEIPLFATIPYITTRRQRFWKRGILALSFLTVVVCVPAGLYWLHINYLPMDLLIEKVLDKSGISGVWDKIKPSTIQ